MIFEDFELPETIKTTSHSHPLTRRKVVGHTDEERYTCNGLSQLPCHQATPLEWERTPQNVRGWQCNDHNCINENGVSEFVICQTCLTIEAHIIKLQEWLEDELISDKTIVTIGEGPWETFKKKAMEEDYQEQEWFIKLTDKEKHLLEALIKAQKAQGVTKAGVPLPLSAKSYNLEREKLQIKFELYNLQENDKIKAYEQALVNLPLAEDDCELAKKAFQTRYLVKTEDIITMRNMTLKECNSTYT